MSFVSPERTFGCQPGPLGAVLARIDRGRGRLEVQIERTPDVFAALAARRRVDPVPRGAVVPITTDEILRLQRELSGNGSEPALRTEHAGPASAMGLRPWATPGVLLDALVAHHNNAVMARLAHPVVLTAAFVLDFLTLSPLVGENRRVAQAIAGRILTWHGHPVARYADVDQTLFARPSAEPALRASQEGWTEDRHCIWPWTQYVAETVADAYDAIEQRVATGAGPRGRSKQERVRRFVLEHAGETFRVAQIRRALPDVSDGTIRLALEGLKREERIALRTPGRDASWQRLRGAG
jgi:hypothetical protein